MLVLLSVCLRLICLISCFHSVSLFFFFVVVMFFFCALQPLEKARYKCNLLLLLLLIRQIARIL